MDEGLGEGDLEREMLLMRSCGVGGRKSPSSVTVLAVALVTARSGRAAARTSPRVDGVLEDSGSAGSRSSSEVDAVGVDHKLNMEEEIEK